MRRLLTRAALCLTLGLLTTIAIAWALALRPVNISRIATIGHIFVTTSTEIHISQGVDRRVVLTDVMYRYLRRVNLKPPNDEAQALREAAARWIAAKDRWLPSWWGEPPSTDIAPESHQWAGCVQDARGWPVVALHCDWAIVKTDPWISDVFLPVRGGIELPPSRVPSFPLHHTVRALPYRPIPVGLTLDTIVFAGAWHLVLLLPRALCPLRSHLRRRRNLCPRCAYSLSNLPPNSPCPECGHTTAH